MTVRPIFRVTGGESALCEGRGALCTHHGLGAIGVAHPVADDAATERAPSPASGLAAKIDIKVGEVPHGCVHPFVVREQILVDAASARFLGEPERDREVAV